MPNLDVIDFIDDGDIGGGGGGTGGGGGGFNLNPNAPLGFVASNVEAKSVTLSWLPVSGAIEYRINYGLTVISNITTNAYTITGLTPETGYGFTVQVQTLDGWSSPSSPVFIITPPIGISTGGGPTGGTGTDKLASFIFMIEYTVPTGSTGSVEIKYRRGKMSTGLYPEVITKTVDKETLINNFGLDPTFEGTRVFNPKEYGL